MPVLCLKGKEEIAKAIGVGKNEVPRLVREESLPVWKRKGKGPWLALPDDLAAWLRRQREKYQGEERV